MFGQINPGPNRVVPASGTGGKSRDELAIIDGKWNRAGMSHEDHRRHRTTGWIGAECHRPRKAGKPGAVQRIRDGHFRIRARQHGDGGRFQTRGNRPDAVQIN